MNIRRKTYDLCKSIFSSPLRNKVKEIIDDIAEDNENKKNNLKRTYFGGLAKKINSQLMGYLVINRDKDIFLKNHLFFQTDNTLLTESELNLIEIAQYQIFILNQNCIKNIIDIDKYCLPSIDPYYGFNYKIPNPNKFDTLFNGDLAKTVSDIFQLHPVILKAIYFGEKFRKSSKKDQLPSEDVILESVNKIESSIRVLGPLKFPIGLSNNIVGFSPDTIEKNYFDYLLSLVCIRASLKTLNELIYNAIIRDSLPVFNEDNIIKIFNLTQHFGGRGLKLKILPNKKSGYGDVGLCFVKMPIFGENLDLCHSEKVQINHSIEFGQTFDVELRIIDENLNPYSSLV